METNRLHQFCVVAETTNMRKAAELLGMSHSALSKSLKLLQENLGLTLLVQVGRGIDVSDDGKVFYEKAKLFLKQEQTLLEVKKNKTDLVRIGTFEVFSTHLMGACFEKYLPGFSLELAELLPGALEKALVDRQIDFGITYEPIPHSNIEHTKVCKVKMDAFANKDAFFNRSFHELPFAAPLIPIHGTPSGVKGLDGWPIEAPERLVTYKVDMLESALALARAGKAAVYIPEFVARLHNSCLSSSRTLISLSSRYKIPTVSRNVYLSRRKSTPENSKIEKALAKLLRLECN
jgi:DNA-binding transcriptional LysR family regulator